MLQSTIELLLPVCPPLYFYLVISEKVSGPICNTPVAIPPGQDPNIRMTQHIENECGKGKEEVSKLPRCANGRCHKVLYAPINCEVRFGFMSCILID